jgi:hypothetical protein
MSEALYAPHVASPGTPALASPSPERDEAALREDLLVSAFVEGLSLEQRKEKLRELADLCETKLGDVAGAIRALRLIVALDASDRETRRTLADLLESNEEWADFALMLEREANIEVDVDKKIAMLRHLASIHEKRRGDPLSAAEALACIANLVPGEATIAGAVTAFERVEAIEQAARVIDGNVELIDEVSVRAGLLERLGGLRERLSDFAGAAEAYAAAGEATDSAPLWEMAERCFTAAKKWERAGRAAVQCAYDSVEPKARARFLALAADHFGRAGDTSAELFNLELAVDIDPTSEPIATRLSDRYAAAGQWAELVVHVVRVAGELSEPAARVSLRRTAANVSAAHLSDRARARQLWAKVLEDGDDREALERLIDDAIQKRDEAEATRWLERLEAAPLEGAKDAAETLRGALRASAREREDDRAQAGESIDPEPSVVEDPPAAPDKTASM